MDFTINRPLLKELTCKWGMHLRKKENDPRRMSEIKKKWWENKLVSMCVKTHTCQLYEIIILMYNLGEVKKIKYHKLCHIEHSKLLVFERRINILIIFRVSLH